LYPKVQISCTGGSQKFTFSHKRSHRY